MFLELGLPDYMFGVSFAAMAGAFYGSRLGKAVRENRLYESDFY